MLATVIFAVISFFIIKKTTFHYTIFGLGLVMAIVLAGPEVRDRFFETFEKKNGVREASAQSRLDLWKNCYTLLIARSHYGVWSGPLATACPNSDGPKEEAHSLWVQTATETGIPGDHDVHGVLCDVYLAMLANIVPAETGCPTWFGDACRMTVASLTGFMVSAMFVSLEST